MFAVIKSGGKQYRVAKDDIITVERLLGEPGDTVALDTVLMLGEDGKAPTVGTPVVDKAAVFAEVVETADGGFDILAPFDRAQHEDETIRAGEFEREIARCIVDLAHSMMNNRKLLLGDAKDGGGLIGDCL